jgi:hypothetical protein
LYGQLIALAGGAFAGLTVTLIRVLREKNGPAIIYLYFWFEPGSGSML